MYRAVIGYLNICRANKLEEETRKKEKPKANRRKWLSQMTRITKLAKQKRNSNTNKTGKPTSTLDFEFDSNDLEYYMKNYSSSTSESTSQVQKRIQPNNNDTKHNKDEHKVVLLIIRVNYIFIIISTPCLIRLCIYIYMFQFSSHKSKPSMIFCP